MILRYHVYFELFLLSFKLRNGIYVFRVHFFFSKIDLSGISVWLAHWPNNSNKPSCRMVSIQAISGSTASVNGSVAGTFFLSEPDAVNFLALDVPEIFPCSFPGRCSTSNCFPRCVFLDDGGSAKSRSNRLGSVGSAALNLYVLDMPAELLPLSLLRNKRDKLSCSKTDSKSIGSMRVLVTSSKPGGIFTNQWFKSVKASRRWWLWYRDVSTLWLVFSKVLSDLSNDPDPNVAPTDVSVPVRPARIDRYL